MMVKHLRALMVIRVANPRAPALSSMNISKKENGPLRDTMMISLLELRHGGTHQLRVNNIPRGMRTSVGSTPNRWFEKQRIVSGQK